MAIQLRRGDYADFDPSQLLDGELAIVLENDPNTDDGTGTYVSYGSSNVKRLLTADESVDVDVATTETAGIVKPDGETITVDEDGTIHGASTVSPSSTTPLADGTASAGSSDDYARGDHRHPTDTSRASATDLTTHTGNGSIHVSTNDRTTWNNKADTTHATTSTYGLVKPDGTTVKVNGSGALSVPIADAGNLGLVKPDGTSVTVDNDGTLHTQGAAIASSETAGIVAPDDDSFYVDSYDGRMTLNYATDSTLGGVKINEYEAVGMQSDDHSLYVKTDETTITKNEYGQLTVIGGGSSIDPSDTAPLMDSTASAGSSDDYARGDHIHPTDTSRASASDLTSHTGNTTVHVTAAERSAWNAKASTATATASANGLMSASDKSKLDGIESGANAYELPLMSPTTRGGAKLGHGLAIEDGALGIGSVTDPTDAGPIVELTAKGWAEQDTTTGKNLLPSMATGQTVNGVTFTVNADGSITLNGTCTNVMSPKISDVSLDAGTYTLSGCPSGGGTNTYRLDFYYNDATQSMIDVGNGSSVTLTEGVSGYARIRIAKDYTCNNLTFYPQLELGSTATSYEPYTGGAPSPSPSFPQEIRRVTGRNLLDTSGASSPYLQRNGDGSFTVSAQPSTAQYIVIGSIDLVGGVTYTLSGGVSTSAYVMIGSFGASNPTPKTFTETADQTENIAIVIQPTTPIGTTFYPQLELGSVAHPYVPYGCVGVDVTVNGTTTTIPIPLPSRGWVAALPDGTADVLTLDGAGGYVWELNVKAATVSLNNSVIDVTTTGLKGAIFDNRDKVAQGDSAALCDRAGRAIRTRTEADYFYTNQVNTVFVGDADDTIEDLKAKYDGATFYYAPAVPTTEQGYVDMPTVPVHAAISSVDLVDLAVRCCADEGAAEIASAWGRRYESRIANLESIVSELVAGA